MTKEVRTIGEVEADEAQQKAKRDAKIKKKSDKPTLKYYWSYKQHKWVQADSPPDWPEDWTPKPPEQQKKKKQKSATRKKRQGGNWVKQKRQQLLEQRPHCWHCQHDLRISAERKLRVPHPRAVTLEHIVSLSKGGTNADDNLALACYACNLENP